MLLAAAAQRAPHLSGERLRLGEALARRILGRIDPHVLEVQVVQPFVEDVDDKLRRRRAAGITSRFCVPRLPSYWAATSSHLSSVDEMRLKKICSTIGYMKVSIFMGSGYKL